LTLANCDADAVINPSLLQASLVRVSRCSHLFILTVLLQDEGFVDAVGAPALSFAVACTVEGKDLVEDTSGCAEQVDYPAWFLQQRPVSAMQELSINWEVPLVHVKQLVEQHLQQGKTHEEVSGTYTWQGRSLSLRLQVEPVDEVDGESSAETEVDIGCYVHSEPRGQELCKTTFRLLLLKAGSTKAEDAVNKSTITKYMRGSDDWGTVGFVCSDTASSWQQVERALREKQAVRADSCLHIKAVVAELE
jgi:hypothetical protein